MDPTKSQRSHKLRILKRSASCTRDFKIFRRILTATATEFDMKIEKIKGVARRREVCAARHLVCYLARDMTKLSFPQIARRLGNRHHTSIMHGASKALRDLRKDGDYRDRETRIRAIVKMETRQERTPNIRIARDPSIVQTLLASHK